MTQALPTATHNGLPQHAEPTIYRLGSHIRLDFSLADADTDPLDAFVGHTGTVREFDDLGRMLVTFTPMDPMDDSSFWVEAAQLSPED